MFVTQETKKLVTYTSDLIGTVILIKNDFQQTLPLFIFYEISRIPPHTDTVLLQAFAKTSQKWFVPFTGRLSPSLRYLAKLLSD